MAEYSTRDRSKLFKSGVVDTADIADGAITPNKLDADVFGAVSTHIIPDTNITYDLGSATNRFRDLYLSGNTINLGDATISADGASIVLPADTQLGTAKLPPVNLTIAPEVLEIQVDSTEAGDDIRWFWTWLTSSLPYARVNITNSPQLTVPLYKKGTYTLNNFAAYEIHDDLTQVHPGYLKWIDGAGTDNVVSWATYLQTTHSHPDINAGTTTQVQRFSINVPEVVTPPTLTLPQGIGYDISFTTAGSYTFGANMMHNSVASVASGNNPNIGPLYRGATYTFSLDASVENHPFYFTTDNGQGFVSGGYVGEYTNGVVGSRNNGTTGQETITFTVPADAPDTLYYQCGIHGSMRGVITVKDLAVETNANGNYVLYFQHTHEGHKTPIEIRPIPSLVNQMCLVYDASTSTFVPQDLATYVENTPSFRNKIQEVAGTATLVAPDGTSLVASVKIFSDASYLPFSGNVAGDIAYTQDSNTMFIWDEVQYNWISTKARSTTEITEGTNLYYTDARARAAITASGSLNYNSSTGELSFTLPELNTSNITEGTNLYYTDARVGSYLSTNGFDTATNIVASITDSAPTTLDTLNELAAALGDDPNFATTVSTQIGLKLNSSSYTASDVLTKIKTVDGSGSGLDADTVDGLDSTQFLRSDAVTNFTAGYITFYGGDVERGRLYPDGDLVLGTATPLKDWDIRDNGGNALFSLDRTTGNSNVLIGTNNLDVGGSATGIRLNSNGAILTSIDGTGFYNTPIYADRRGTNNAGNILSLALNGYWKSSIGVVGTSGAGADGGITFNTIYGNDTLVEQMRIDVNGVGIGTQNPEYKLHVIGTDYAGMFETSSSADGDAIRISLKSPVSQGQLELDWFNNSSRTGGGYGMIQTGKSSNSPDLAIMAGNVGIGTSSPTVKLDISGAVKTSVATNISYRTSVGSSNRKTIFKMPGTVLKNGADSGNTWHTMRPFTAHKSGTIGIRAGMYITSGQYYFSFRIRCAQTDEIMFEAKNGGGFGAYAYPAGQAGSVHDYRYYEFTVDNIVAGYGYYIEMAPSSGDGQTVLSYNQDLWLGEFEVFSDSYGVAYGSPTYIHQDIGSSGEDVNYSYMGIGNGGMNVQEFRGTEETFLGWFTLRAYSRFLDIRLNLNSQSYMFFMRATGYHYSYGVFNSAMRGGYAYTGSSIINQSNSTPSGSKGFYNFYKDAAGFICAKLDQGGNGYSEGQLALFFGTHGPAPSSIRVTHYAQNDNTGNYF